MVTSKLLYQGLRTVLVPPMKNAGFKRMKGGQLGWTRRSGSEHLFFWFQCDKWGRSEAWGSRFTLEFQMAPGADDVMTLKGRFERIGHLLEGFAELDELRRRNNAIIERLPGTLNGQVVKGTIGDGIDFVAEGFVVDNEPAVYGRDLWMNYYSMNDVNEWARYFEMKLLHFIDLFEGQERSPQGLARDRFNMMMGQVQAAKELSGKISKLESYIGTEADAYFRSEAERWLAYAREKASKTA